MPPRRIPSRSQCPRRPGWRSASGVSADPRRSASQRGKLPDPLLFVSVCHSDDSRPPAAPVSTGVAARERLHLTSEDGTRFMAHAARPARPNGRGVVILPDIRGLHAFYRELADLFADAGFDAIAI